MKKAQAQGSADVVEVYRQLGLGHLIDTPYNKDMQIRNLKKFSLYEDDRRYYASGDTRTDRGIFPEKQS